MIIPRGVTEAAFLRFLAACEAALGAEHVMRSDAVVSPYGRLMIPFDEADHMPGAVISPQSLDEVRAVVAAANADKVPLWPTSTGRNLGYGGSAVADRGTVVLDLRRMNRISDFDPVLGTVVVEPGVTYQQLQDYLQANNLDFWIDFPGPGPIVSPMGNTLERGGGVTPYGDHFANSCGFEVLLADGALLRTGMGGVKNTTSWQSFRYGYGPWLDGIFTQSNFGVVTKMGLWLMPAPEAHRTIMAVWPEDSDIAKLVDAVRPLRMDGTIQNPGVLGNATIFLAATTPRGEIYQGQKAVPQDVIMKAIRAQGLGAWMYIFSLYGRPDRIEVDWRAVKARLEASGAHLIQDVHAGAQINELDLQAFSILNWVGGGGLTWFSPVTPTRGADAARQMSLARQIFERHDCDFMTGVAINPREMLNVMPIIYDRQQPGRIEQVRACFTELVDEFGAAGYGLYRTGLGFMDRVAGLHGQVNLEVNRRLKRALDPNGIFAPGKSGIRL